MIKIAEGYKARYSAGQEDEIPWRSTCSCAGAIVAPCHRRGTDALVAIGEPELIDTRLDPRLSRIFSNRLISRSGFAEPRPGVSLILE